MVLNGIDRIDKYGKLFKGKRIGLITAPSGLSAGFEANINILHEKFGLMALFSPEHGVRGNMGAGDDVDTYEDPYIHVPAYSLYRKDSKRFTAEMLDNVDMIVYDIQDVGTRYYTFIYTMLYAMEDCAKSGREFVVLDRLNPLGGTAVEGNIIGEGFNSFIGAYPLCMRYGLTVGEFAVMANTQLHLGCDLHVIPCEGWDRSMLFPDTGRIWVMPSPGLPRFEAALLYPGTCLFEGTNVSVGRGTTAPFELIGAPYMDAVKLAGRMNAKGLPGVIFRPAYFTPFTSVYAGRQCEGVQIHITDADEVLSVNTGVTLLFEIRGLYGEQFEFPAPENEKQPWHIDLLAGNARLRDPDVKLSELLESYRNDSAEFTKMKSEFHLY